MLELANTSFGQVLEKAWLTPEWAEVLEKAWLTLEREEALEQPVGVRRVFFGTWRHRRRALRARGHGCEMHGATQRHKATKIRVYARSRGGDDYLPTHLQT